MTRVQIPTSPFNKMTIIIGHRGAMDLAPANTIPSFKKAIELEHKKIKLLSDIPALIDFFLIENIKYR